MSPQVDAMHLHGGVDGPGCACSPAMSRIPPKSHFRPRTPEGWTATIAFVVLFLLAMPPFTHVVWDRPDSWIAGWPSFFVVLLVIYTGLVAVLVWAWQKGV